MGWMKTPEGPGEILSKEQTRELFKANVGRLLDQYKLTLKQGSSIDADKASEIIMEYMKDKSTDENSKRLLTSLGDQIIRK